MNDDCRQCAYDTHVCHGCGTNVSHGDTSCDECHDLLDRQGI